MFYAQCAKLLSNIYALILLFILNNMWLIFLCNIEIVDHWSGQMHKTKFLCGNVFYFKQNWAALHDLLSLVLTAIAEVTRFLEILPEFWVFLAGLKVDLRRTLGRYPKHAIY